LKAVTKYKLGYDPIEVDPEDMLRYCTIDSDIKMDREFIVYVL
jgi:hypothetical protein